MSKSVPPPSKRPSWLIPALVLVAVAALVLAVVLLNSANQPQSVYVPEITGRPGAVVAQAVVNHGDVQMEETVESAFTIRNVGDQPLVIFGEPRVELVQGCCPPRAAVSAMTIPPGQESTVSMSYTMHEMMGGPHEFRVHVLTNDPNQAEIVLTALSNWVE